MKNKFVVFLLAIIILMLISAFFSYASAPDDDGDKVPNCVTNNPNEICDKCPDPPQGQPVDKQFGCSCEQKTASNCAGLYAGQCCSADNNPCTDDCSISDGKAVCNYADNTNICSGGACYNRVCRPDIMREQVRCVFRGSGAAGILGGSSAYVRDSPVQGFLDDAPPDSGVITGWAFDPNFPSSSYYVFLTLDAPLTDHLRYKPIGTFDINVLRQDVNAAKGLSGKHGFVYFTNSAPQNLRDGKYHRVYAYFLGPRGFQLIDGSPRIVKMPEKVNYDVLIEEIMDEIFDDLRSALQKARNAGLEVYEEGDIEENGPGSIIVWNPSNGKILFTFKRSLEPAPAKVDPIIYSQQKYDARCKDGHKTPIMLFNGKIDAPTNTDHLDVYITKMPEIVNPGLLDGSDFTMLARDTLLEYNNLDYIPYLQEVNENYRSKFVPHVEIRWVQSSEVSQVPDGPVMGQVEQAQAIDSYGQTVRYLLVKINTDYFLGPINYEGQSCLKSAIMHEFGHVFGLDEDYNNKNSIMVAGCNGDAEIKIADKQALSLIYSKQPLPKMDCMRRLDYYDLYFGKKSKVKGKAPPAPDPSPKSEPQNIPPDYSCDDLLPYSCSSQSNSRQFCSADLRTCNCFCTQMPDSGSPNSCTKTCRSNEYLNPVDCICVSTSAKLCSTAGERCSTTAGCCPYSHLKCDGGICQLDDDYAG